MPLSAGIILDSCSKNSVNTPIASVHNGSGKPFVKSSTGLFGSARRPRWILMLATDLFFNGLAIVLKNVVIHFFSILSFMVVINTLGNSVIDTGIPCSTAFHKALSDALRHFIPTLFPPFELIWGVCKRTHRQIIRQLNPLLKRI